MTLHLIEGYEIEKVASLFASAFREDPLFMYFFPNPNERQKKSKYFFRAQLMMCHSFTYVLKDMKGAIIYQRPQDKAKSISVQEGFPLIINVGLKSIIKAITYQRYSKKILNKLNSLEMDHLVLICVDEKSRNKGVARSMIHQLNASKVYLETQNQDNLDFYHKLGFKLKHSSTFNDHRKPINHFVLVKEDLV